MNFSKNIFFYFSLMLFLTKWCVQFLFSINIGDSDVGDIIMMVIDFRCWWQNHYVGEFFRYVGDFLNVLNRSPTSQPCHQHIWSPTSM